MSARALTTVQAADTSRATPSISPFVQKKCAACASTEHEADKDRALMQKRGAGQGGGGGLSLIDAALASPGAPLDATARSHMENRFGRDFSAVRVRDDALAHESARSVDALAYTVGSDVVFGAGQYRPHTREGSHLLAHELAHTVQQGGLQRRAAGSALGTDPMPALESEADRAADAATAPQAGAMPQLTRLSTPVLARATARTFKKVEGLPDSVDQEGQREGTTQAFFISSLAVPIEKGKGVVPAWQARALAGALETSVDVSSGGLPPVALKEARFDLIPKWAQKFNLDGPGIRAGMAQYLKKDDAVGITLLDGTVCQIDHIVEQQFGGTSVPENLHLLEQNSNRKAGGAIYDAISQAALDLKKTKKYEALTTIILSFGKAAGKDGSCDACCDFEAKVDQLAKDKEIKRAGEDPKAGLPGYRISAGGLEAEFFLDSAAPEDVKILNSGIAENRAAAALIVGMRLLSLNRKTKHHTIAAKFDARKGTKSPLEFNKKGNKSNDPDKALIKFNVLDAGAKLPDGKLKGTRGDATAQKAVGKSDARPILLDTKPGDLELYYPFLSTGQIKTLELGENGIKGTGTITPSIPIIGKLDVAFTDDSLVVTKKFGLSEAKPPIPGFHITKDELDLKLAPEFIPSGIVAFSIGPKSQPLGTGSVTASVKDGAFSAQGKLAANVPGFKQAEADIFYDKQNGWSGQVALEASPLPKTKDVKALIKLGPDGLSVTGGLTIDLPGENNSVALTASYAKDKFALSGKAELTPPFKNASKIAISLGYDGTNMTGTGKGSATIAGQNAELEVAYFDGAFSGTGKVTIKKGEARGALTVAISRQNKVSGKGSMSYPITKDLIASADIELKEDESVHVVGAVTAPGPIEIFKAFGDQKTLLKVPTIKFGVPGASIGPVGLQVTIDGGLEIHYQVGPGQLLNTVAKAAFNPFDDKPDLDVVLSTQLKVGATAGVGGFIRGGIGVDALIASASGGITVGATADLVGSAGGTFELHYTKNNFSLKADASIDAGLKLGLSLKADLTATLGGSWLGVTWTKSWDLAKWTFDTGLHLGMTVPLYYDKLNGLKTPSAADIKWVLPTLSPQGLIEQSMKSSKPDEKKK